MSELTKEYLDKKLDKLATKDDLNMMEGGLKSHIEKEVNRLETKIETEIAELAGMVSRRFDEVEKRLDVRAEVDELKLKMNKVWQALNIKN